MVEYVDATCFDEIIKRRIVYRLDPTEEQKQRALKKFTRDAFDALLMKGHTPYEAAYMLGLIEGV